MIETMKQARQIIWRYRHETPLGNQPHMIAHEADEVIERIDQALEEALETKEEYHWSKLIAGVRVDDDSVVIKLKGGNDEARYLCNELIHEMEIFKEKNT